METINGIDCGIHIYEVRLWCGKGYTTQVFHAYAFDEDEALEYTLAYIEAHDMNTLFYTQEEVQELGLTEDEKEDMFMYIDPTMIDGQAYPAYVLAENLGIELWRG